MVELAKARSMQPYIILYKTTLQGTSSEENEAPFGPKMRGEEND